MYARRFIGLCSLCGDSFFVAGGEEGACERESWILLEIGRLMRGPGIYGVNLYRGKKGSRRCRRRRRKQQLFFVPKRDARNQIWQGNFFDGCMFFCVRSRDIGAGPDILLEDDQGLSFRLRDSFIRNNHREGDYFHNNISSSFG